MSVIVKGMDMPKSCRECPFVMVSTQWTYPYAITCVASPRREITSTLSRQSWCPLVELPNTDLVDADTVEFWGEHEHGYRWTGKIVVHRNPEDAYREDFGKESDNE